MSFDHDVAVIGAGPVAIAIACLLSQTAPEPGRIALFGTLPSARTSDSHDPRTLAMNYGTRQVLDRLHAWPAHASAIHDIHVSQRGRLGRTHIRHTDFDVPALGYTVAYADLLEALNERARSSDIVRHPAVASEQVINAASGIAVSTGGGPIRTRVAVLADGMPQAGIVREYDQHALLATVRASQSRPGWAYERFCQEGPLALLPHPQGVDQYSVVWCCRPGTADHLRNLPDDAFVAALQDAFGERLGRLSLHGARHVFPLSLKARSTFVDGRIVAIGNAAQTLHPVAGQGLNLGLRDAVQLATALAPALAHGANDTSDAIPTALATYSRRRMADRWITGGVTDLLPRVFATGWAPLEHACGAALLALDASARLRAPLARHLLYGTRT